ncbi:MAG: hypothetical protein NVS1B4_17130 [Gemmatimonadaceae bacterium]
MVAGSGAGAILGGVVVVAGIGLSAWAARLRRGMSTFMVAQVARPRIVLARDARYPASPRWNGLCALLACAALASPVVGHAQAVRYGVLLDGARKALEVSWSEDARQSERAYCVTGWSYAVSHVSREAPAKDDTVFRVLAVGDAPVRNAGPSSVEFECPTGSPELHTHTPTTCATDDPSSCMVGGLNAYSCQPSRQDFEKLLQRGDRFAIVQCDRRTFRFYYASEYLPPGSAIAAARTPAPTRAAGRPTP